MTATELAGRKALLMGVSSELAEPLARAIAASGADVALMTATSDAEEAFAMRRIVRSVRDLGRRSLDLSVDMAIGTAVQVAVRQVAKEFGGIDLAVVGPDLRLDKPAERLSDAEWSRLLHGNLSAVFYACRSLRREMAGGDTGGVILVLLPSSGEPADAAYQAVRAGAEALVATLERQWATDGVAVNAVHIETGTDVTAAVLGALKR